MVTPRMKFSSRPRAHPGRFDVIYYCRLCSISLYSCTQMSVPTTNSLTVLPDWAGKLCPGLRGPAQCRLTPSVNQCVFRTSAPNVTALRKNPPLAGSGASDHPGSIKFPRPRTCIHISCVVKTSVMKDRCYLRKRQGIAIYFL
jgi:hypothetical protein